MTDSTGSNRRDFLTGRAAQRVLRAQADDVTDAILDGTAEPSPPQGSETIRLETRAMACQWAVVMNPGPPRQVMVASDALDIVHAAEDELTVYRDSSDVARLNQRAAEEPQRVSESLFSLLIECQHLCDATSGAFDPAMGALIQLWRTARQNGTVPGTADVEQALLRTGMSHVHLDHSQQTVSYDVPGLGLDFGAIGKGEAVDRAQAHLQAEGLESYMVHGGHSSLFARGHHAGHTGWPVGIRNPLFTEQRYVTVLLRDQGMSTSGGNVQYFRHQGRKYGHIVDPRTGWPAEGLLSVTVLARQAAQADALSTAFYVMGLDKARQYCDDHPEVGAILIPTPVRGRNLEPIVCNLPEEQLFFENPSQNGSSPPP